MDGFKHSRWKRFSRFLRRRYRLVILNDTTFGEKFSLRLSPWGIIIGVLAITIIMTTIVISLVAFTPLREYIPGYGDVTERKQILKLNIKADSIEQSIESRDLYITSILNAFHEKVETKGAKPKKDTTGKLVKVNIKPRTADIEFRAEYEAKKGSPSASVAKLIYAGLSEIIFFTPVKGFITTSYDITEEHLGVDIVTREDETIKSTLDGTVVYTGFTAEDGNIVQVQHNNNLISIYKHCAAILKTRGDRVKSGEAIAVVGNTGEKSNGPHLHFELWYNGSSVNPQEFVAF
jgi:murein DD-endopeptidase MepM/ murein hydrolase activator NlpD